MDRKTAEKTSTATIPDANISEPTLGRTMAFFFLISFVGLLAIVPMRKVRTPLINHHQFGEQTMIIPDVPPANRP